METAGEGSGLKPGGKGDAGDTWCAGGGGGTRGSLVFAVAATEVQASSGTWHGQQGVANRGGGWGMGSLAQLSQQLDFKTNLGNKVSHRWCLIV